MFTATAGGVSVDWSAGDWMTTLQPERNRMDSAAQPAATSDLRFMFPPGLSLRFERRCQEYDEEDLFLKMIISGWSAKRRVSLQHRKQLLELRVVLDQLAPLIVDAVPRLRRQEPSQGRREFLVFQAEVEVAAALVPARRIGFDEFLGEGLRVGSARDPCV